MQEAQISSLAPYGPYALPGVILKQSQESLQSTTGYYSPQNKLKKKNQQNTNNTNHQIALQEKRNPKHSELFQLPGIIHVNSFNFQWRIIKNYQPSWWPGRGKTIR